jgi:NAD(P)-dependent dehydrogenase (short-subunit alcohol dehydrogenase family)
MTERVVLITGASGGVGRGIAQACSAAGWRVWIAARRETEGQAVADEIRERGGVASFVLCNVSDQQSVQDVIAKVVDTDGRLDGIVHNATSGLSSIPSRLSTYPVAELLDHVAVTLRGTYYLAQAGFQHLVSAGGSFVFLTSEAGFEGKVLLGPYAVVKAAERGLLRTLAREWGPHGVRVNGIAPLATSPAMDRAFVLDPEMEGRVMRRIPLQRLGDPERDVGPVVQFLLSDDARFVTGATVMVDGGSCQIS